MSRLLAKSDPKPVVQTELWVQVVAVDLMPPGASSTAWQGALSPPTPLHDPGGGTAVGSTVSVACLCCHPSWMEGILPAEVMEENLSVLFLKELYQMLT